MATLWQVRSYDDREEFKDVYDLCPSFVSLKIHHGGRFTKFPGRQYLKDKTHYVELVDTDAFSVHELEDMMHEIGYKTPRPTYYHFLVPGKDLDFGLHALGSDMDIVEFLKFVPQCKVFEIYTEHWISKLNTNGPMKRIGNVNKVIQKANGPLTPSATKVLESIKTEAMKYDAIWNGDCRYQVNGPWGDNAMVDIKEKSCSCRRWELIGIPCKHVVATIWNMASSGADVGIPEVWVHEVYWLDTWRQMYSFCLEPINGPKMWPKSSSPTKITPPTHHKQVGRPKKKRVKSATEITDGKRLKRVGKTVRCVKCGQEGHNKRTCKGQAPS